MKHIAIVLLLLSAPIAIADDRAIAVEYVRARCTILTKGATAADVEKVVAFLADDAVVEHPAFNAVVRGKEAIRRGMVSHLDEYTGDARESGIVVLDSVEAPGAIVFRTNISFVVGEGAERKSVSRDGLIVVEVRDAQITRLIEY